ncbi:energy transducer TonB [Noviherbaspirillum aridicola]|uniref:Cell division and transport-associated protein TolA n=1 Tax=Noviherbaspirillum aridicola TaxID=2849687 RepID=A0ABQ4Q9X1_9BURK|nr:energy transducer TonB [Noviherbaspirillum aridicola]GIZ53844.1 hypothetical protein NCCP691_38580 [Noviherbaspirillum aridicola]
MTDASQYNVPKEPGRLRSLLLAALVHLALLVFLWVGIRWQSETPTTIEAEVWSPQPQEAAPPPLPQEEPKPEPEPRPEPKPEPVKEPPRPKVEEPPKPKVDIALEQEKKRKEEEKRKREEEQERLAKKREEDERRKREEEKQKLAKLEKEKLEKEKLEKEKLEKEKLARLEKERKEKEAADKKRRQDEADQKLAAKVREEEMKRMTGAVGTGGNGDAPKSQGGRASSEYAGRIGAKIKSNITFIAPEGLPGNPPVEYEVRLLPDGSVAGMRKLKSSGVPGFDEAVARAIERSQPFPKDSNGSVPSTFIGIHKPKDQ